MTAEGTVFSGSPFAASLRSSAVVSVSKVSFKRHARMRRENYRELREVHAAAIEQSNNGCIDMPIIILGFVARKPILGFGG